MRSIKRAIPDIKTNVDDNNKFLTQTEWKGIIEPKNIFSVEQNSFSDAKNIFVDNNHRLVSRDPLQVDKTLPATAVATGYTLSEVYKVGDKLLYVSKNNENLYRVIIDEAILLNLTTYHIAIIEQYVICFNEQDAKVYDINNTSEGWQSLSNLAEIPVTLKVVGNVETTYPANEFTKAYKEEYEWSNQSRPDLPSGNAEVVLIANGKKYTWTIVGTSILTDYRILRPLNIKLADDDIFSTANEYICIARKDYFLISYDGGENFDRVWYPLHGTFLNVASISEDGDYFFFVASDAVYRCNLGDKSWTGGIFYYKSDSSAEYGSIATASDENAIGYNNICHFKNSDMFTFMLYSIVDEVPTAYIFYRGPKLGEVDTENFVGLMNVIKIENYISFSENRNKTEIDCDNKRLNISYDSGTDITTISGIFSYNTNSQFLFGLYPQLPYDNTTILVTDTIDNILYSGIDSSNYISVRNSTSTSLAKGGIKITLISFISSAVELEYWTSLEGYTSPTELSGLQVFIHPTKKSPIILIKDNFMYISTKYNNNPDYPNSYYFNITKYNLLDKTSINIFPSTFSYDYDRDYPYIAILEYNDYVYFVQENGRFIKYTPSTNTFETLESGLSSPNSTYVYDAIIVDEYVYRLLRDYISGEYYYKLVLYSVGEYYNKITKDISNSGYGILNYDNINARVYYKLDQYYDITSGNLVGLSIVNAVGVLSDTYKYIRNICSIGEYRYGWTKDSSYNQYLLKIEYIADFGGYFRLHTFFSPIQTTNLSNDANDIIAIEESLSNSNILLIYYRNGTIIKFNSSTSTFGIEEITPFMSLDSSNKLISVIKYNSILYGISDNLTGYGTTALIMYIASYSITTDGYGWTYINNEISKNEFIDTTLGDNFFLTTEPDNGYPYELSGGWISNLSVYNSDQSQLASLPTEIEARDLTWVFADYFYIKVGNIIYTNNLVTNDSATLTYTYLPSDNSFTKVPNVSYSDTELFLAFDNLLQITKNNKDGVNILFNLPIINNQSFISNITGLINISTTEVAVFLINKIFVCTKVEDNVYGYRYDYYNTKLSTGIKLNDNILNTLEGSYTIFPTRRGLAAMSYQAFMSTTDQTLSYISDNIKQLWTNFYDAGTIIKMIQWRDWVVITNGTKTILLFDIVNAVWWQWKIPLDINMMFTDQVNLNVISSGLYIFKPHKIYKDLPLSSKDTISHYIKSQQLHMSAPNHYKNLKQLVFQLYNSESEYAKHTINAQIKLYRKRIVVKEPEIIDFKIEGLRTFVKRFNYWKINEVQWGLSNDENNANPAKLQLNGVSIKYEISEEVK